MISMNIQLYVVQLFTVVIYDPDLFEWYNCNLYPEHVDASLLSRASSLTSHECRGVSRVSSDVHSLG